MAFFIFQESDQFRTDQVAAPVAAAAVHQGPADIAAGLAVADNIAVDNMAAGKAGFRIAAHAPLLQADLLAVFLARAPKALGMVAWVVAPVAAAPAVVLPPVVMDSSAPWAPQGPVVLAAHALLERSGCTVETARDGAEAASLVRAGGGDAYDVI
ncbi:MAG: hypothetical protein EB121_04645, partial [Alphaproteobacteria bacterium]|nr:hypothetical protein [Alphaproteobacteria bacterium]